MFNQLLLDIRDQFLHIIITINSVAEGVRIILWYSMPEDLCSKIYVSWDIIKIFLIIFLAPVWISNGLHHLFCSTDIHYEVVNMDEDVFIIMFTCRQPVFGH